MPITFQAWAVAGMLALCAVEATAEDSAAFRGPTTGERQWTLSVRWENDTVASDDRFYTNGVAVSLAHTGESWLDPVADWLPWGQGRRTVAYSLSQAMFTPEDTTRATLDPGDRPYAGVLTAGLTLHVDRDNRYDGLKLVVGVVGPWAGAGETQRGAHRTIRTTIPQGWDAQLHNEPVFTVMYEHRRKYRLWGEANGWGLEVLPAAGVMLGTWLTQGYAGGQLRIGYNIPDDFGTTLLRGMSELPPPRGPHVPFSECARSRWGVFLHAAIGGALVLRDITLDGNTFRDSPHVDKKLLVPAAAVGAAVGNQCFLLDFSYVFSGKEFEGQREAAEYGAVTLNYFF